MKKSIPYLKSFTLSFLSMACVISLVNIPKSNAADHIDSPTVKQAENKSADIADLYVFREGDQSGNTADNDKLSIVLTTNGFTAAGQSNPFSTDVEYKVALSTDKANLSGTAKWLSLRFGRVMDDGRQKIWLNGYKAGWTTVGSTPTVNSLKLGNSDVKVFAGMRDDPFFLDFVTTVVGGKVSTINADGSTTKAVANPTDSFAGTNVSAIVLSVPNAWFQANNETKFWAWAKTVKYPVLKY